MLGGGFPKAAWPGCGEIDIMENLGQRPGKVYGTLHGPGYSGAKGIQGSFTAADGSGFDQAYHVFAVDWEPGRIRWLVDGKVYSDVTPARLPKGARWVFDQPFFILLNFAVGGEWPGNPDASAKYPQTLLVDYVRVYSRR
jgi:beta-glucanase (GH16 family)